MRGFALLLAVALAQGLPGPARSAEERPAALDVEWAARWSQGPDGAQATLAPLSEPLDPRRWTAARTPLIASGIPERRTLWMRRQLPNLRFRDPVLMVQGVDQALEVWVDHALIYRLGDLDAPRERFATATWTHLVTLPPDFAGRELALRIQSNYTRAGVAEVRLGPRSAFVSELLGRDVEWLVLGLLAVFVGLVEVVVFLGWGKQRLHLAFGGFALAIGTFVLSQTSLAQLLVDAPVAWTWVVFGALYLTPIGFLVFVEELGHGSRASLRLARAFSTAYAVASLALAGCGLVSLTRTLAPFLALVAADALLAAGITLRAALRGSREARILLLGVAAVLVAAANDILVSVGVVTWSMRLAGKATLAFLLSLGGIAARRFAEINRQLRAYSHELEQTVDVRTRELQAAKHELELRNRDLSERNQLLADRAARDSLTHLFNHGAFMAQLDAFLASGSAAAFPICLVMMDLDHFKPINDRYGHQFGDEVLRQVAAVLREAVRDGDLAGRYGGEEFALLLPRCSPEAAAGASERIRQSIAAIRIARAPELRVTASFGIAPVAEPPAEVDGGTLMARADEALYRAKSTGRNRVCIYDADADAGSAASAADRDRAAG